mmetsp:Transcript_37485/g.78532  ORF Transcript_37485/g.78532 Transcript_37485/m.78532 type:complete len:80 (+) Transcript_37485:162-401(+)
MATAATVRFSPNNYVRHVARHRQLHSITPPSNIRKNAGIHALSSSMTTRIDDASATVKDLITVRLISINDVYDLTKLPR